MQLKIRRKSKSANVIYGMLLFVLFERLLESIGFPHSMIFLLDAANLYLLMNMLVCRKLNYIFTTKMVKIHLLIFIVATIMALFNGVGITLIIWALRNLLRFYIFFGACISYLGQEDVIEFYVLLEKLFYVNIGFIFIQYLIGYRQDYLGGLFGTETGANAFSNVFMLLVCSYTVARWFEKKEKIQKTALIVLLSLFISIITETKIFLIEIIIIVVLNAVVIGILEKKYKALVKGTLITIIVVGGVIIGAKYIAKMYPNLSNSNFLSVEGVKYILTRESGYTGYGDLNRLTAITSINKLDYYNSSYLHQLFGIGLGGAEYSSSSTALQSAFYSRYAYLHYYWFSHAWMYLECGYVGLIGYILGLLSNIPSGVKIIRRWKRNMLDMSAVVTGVVISTMTIILYIYNQSLRVESAYLIYFAFSAIFIGGKEVHENRKDIC